MTTAPKIITIDVETAPLESFTWGLFDQNVGLEQIKTEWAIISYAAKWLGKPTILYADTSGRGATKVRDDKALLGKIRALLDEADIVVAQNGNSFDIKKINARLAMHGYPPYSPVRVIDTLSAARKHFGFTSNKLAWLSKHLTDTPKDEHRAFPGFELWAEVLKDNPAAWREMKKYNKRDVVATEKLYLKLRPWIDAHLNVSTYTAEAEPACPKCGSSEVQKHGLRVLQAGIYQRYQCQACGGWARGKTMLNSARVRRAKLV